MSPRRFFLAVTPEEGPPALAPEDLHHALDVIRLVEGDRLIGLDGRGSAWPLRVTGRKRARLELESTGAARCAPPPGTPEAIIPAVDVHVSLPRGGRAEEMVGRLTQLGAATVRPIITEHSQSAAREAGPKRLERLGRTAREACKQCGRLWVPEITEPASLLEALEERPPEGVDAVLDAGGATPLADLAATWRRAGVRSIRLWVGPEGGFDRDELERFSAAGIPAARVGPHVLRTETAAEAAVAIVIGR